MRERACGALFTTGAGLLQSDPQCFTQLLFLAVEQCLAFALFNLSVLVSVHSRIIFKVCPN